MFSSQKSPPPNILRAEGGDAASDLSLAEFEQDMDALAEGLEDFRVRYEGSYSRGDIYWDPD